LEVAARHFGFEPVVKICSFKTDTDVVATTTLGNKAPEDLHNSCLYNAIMQRQTNRRFFVDKPIATPLLEVCINLAADCAVEFVYLTTPEDKNRVANLSEVAIRYQHNQL
jgi:hypothetical protein